jgi:MHS family proline/betaine transporter-like MFS transporter
MQRSERSADSSPSGPGLLVLLAACAGNGFEFYSVTIYAFVAVTMSKLFFPAARPGVSMLLTFGVFGVSYVVRPLGGLLLGAYADRAGRRASLLLCIYLMLAGTALLAFCPVYARIGLFAPLLILLARMLQGFALGGDFGSATAFLLEQAPPGKRSLYTSLQFASQGFGGLLGGLVGYIVSHLSAAQMLHWGWRVPFLIGLWMAPIGLYLRAHMRDTDEFLHAKHVRQPIAVLLREHGLWVAVAAASTAVLSANIYLRVYLPAFAQMHLGIPLSSTYVLLFVSSGVTAMLIPLGASFVTPRNALWWMATVAIAMMASALPLLRLVDSHRSEHSLIAVHGLLTVMSALYSAPQAWFVSTLFPTRVRAVGVGTSFNVGVMLFGGFAPAIYASEAARTGSIASASKYLIFAGCVSLIAIGMAMLWPPKDQMETLES